jgi:hypothetical protein
MKFTEIDAVYHLTKEPRKYGFNADGLQWRDTENDPPTKKAIQAKIKELQADYDSKKYQRDRLQEYPDLQECIHAILDDDLTSLQAKRKLVKEKYPKPK